MTKKQSTFYCVIGLILGATGGIAGTAFSMGAEQQRIKGALDIHTAAIAVMKADDIQHEVSIQKEMDRYVDIITVQITHLQESIRELTTTVSDLSTDVQVLKAIMERMEEDFKKRSNLN
jgi:hypothetical protein